jgi:hypothetical protein
MQYNVATDDIVVLYGMVDSTTYIYNRLNQLNRYGFPEHDFKGYRQNQTRFRKEIRTLSYALYLAMYAAIGKARQGYRKHVSGT